MSINVEKLRIVYYPDPVLREPTKEVDPLDPEVHAVAKRMLAIMHEAPGVGLAAPQIGLPWRLFVANHTQQPEDDRIYINPVLSEPTAESGLHQEGCLSLPDIQVDMRRPIGVTISAYDLNGEPFTLTSDEFLARIWQHEFDHLEGKLIIDRMNRRDAIANKRLIKALEDYA